MFEQRVSGTINALAKLSCTWSDNEDSPETVPTPSKHPYSCSPISHAPIVSSEHVLVATSDQGSLVFLNVVIPPNGDLADNGRFELIAEVAIQFICLGRIMLMENRRIVLMGNCSGAFDYSGKRLYKGWKKNCH
jgi:hypothetical protein